MKQLISVRILALLFLTLIGGGNLWAADVITLSGTNLSLDCGTSSTTKTGNLSITATDASKNTVSGLSYKYTSTSPAVATVANDGTVTAVMAGNTTITVDFEGNANYEAASCTISVKVTNSSVTSTTKIYNNIAELQDAAQATVSSNGSSNTPKIQKCALVFGSNNPATVVGVFTNDDPDINEGAGYIFIVDKSNRGLMLPKPSSTDSKYFDIFSKDLKTGDTFTGTLIGTYTEKTSRIPAFNEILNSQKINSTDYNSSITINTDGEATGEDEATYPINEVKDVNALASTNETVTDGNISTAAYGPYLNTIVSVTGTIKENIDKSDESFYLMQKEDCATTETTNRIYLNTSQISGITMTDYVGTTGKFEGILIKRNNSEPKLVILKADFFEISKIYINESDDENRIYDLVKTGALDSESEVDVYVHRTKLVNAAGAWNTLCFPFDLDKDEFQSAFGCELTDLATPKTDYETNVNNNGDLLFESVTDLKITAGVPYIMKASGTQSYSTNTELKMRNDDGTVKSPSEMIASDANYYAHIGKKTITVVPPKEVKAKYSNAIVNGDFYFRGLYGQKKYTNDDEGNLTETPISDNGSQKYQYISTAAGNYLKYLPSGSTLAFNGLRAYFYFPNWSAEENNKNNSTSNGENAKIRIALNGETTAIDNAFADEEANDASSAIYNLNGQKVSGSYKGIAIRNGKKIVIK